LTMPSQLLLSCCASLSMAECVRMMSKCLAFGTCHGVSPIAVRPFCASHVTGSFCTFHKISALHTSCLCSWPAIGTGSSALPVSNKRHDCCLSSFSVSSFSLNDCKYILRDAFHCIVQPNTTSLDCILYLMQSCYDPSMLSSSAN